MDPVEHGLDLGPLELGLDTMCEEGVAGFVPGIDHAFVGVAGDLAYGHVGTGSDLGDQSLILLGEVGDAGYVDLVDDEQDRLVREERFDGVE